ncbi:MAG: M48 family metallopeptidase [Planctomycetes bacterium]|nr:M48 family metallopeptidase [Planctomycetota bacterium]
MVTAELRLAELTIAIERKAVVHVHLSVYPPAGSIRMVAPPHLSDQALRAFAIRKLPWIRQQQAKLLAQERESPREMLTRESHWVWGRRRLLRVVEHDAPPAIELHPQRLVMRVRPGADAAARTALLAAWYREQVRERADPLLARWGDHLGVRPRHLYVQHMKTRWGSCTPATGSIRLNTELARKPPSCLEYILVHELLHLLEPTHSRRFTDLLDRHLPDWQGRRDLLNRLPIRHEDWAF